jgi:hypothetical protein
LQYWVGYGPAREFLMFRSLMCLAATDSPPPVAYGDHYREMAGSVRELARYTRSPGIRR